jgi:PAS domain S-box-containing protein
MLVNHVCNIINQMMETPVDNLFQEFQSSFGQATPEEKRRLAIRALIEGEILLRQIAANVEQVFWLCDLQTDRILYVSPAFETIWGRSSESLYADPSILIESVHPEDRVQVMVAQPHNDHKPFNQAYRILRPDGNLRWIFERTFLMRDETGEPIYLFCIAQDITEQKQVDLALRKTLDRRREQFDLSRRMSLARKPEAVLKTLMSAFELRSAQHATLLFFNNPKVGMTSGVEVMTDWLSSQHLSPWLNESYLYEEPAFWELPQPNRTVVITEIQSDLRLTPLVRDFLQDRQIQTLVIFPLVASGNWLGCLLVYYQQEHHFDPLQLRHLKVLVDQATITLYNLQLLKVEEESRHEAERATEIKTEFLAMISHELRTPLTSIIGFTTTLLAEDVAWEPDEQRDFIQTIQQEADRLQELIDHLLDLSRLEAGMLPIALDPHSLHEIIKDALPQFHSLTRRQTLTMHLPANLPLVYVDARRIAQVLVNLVRNASTYAPQGTEINISANVRGGFVQIIVNDQGPGIPPEEHKRVFKAFQRGENAEKTSAQGAGLGLAICKGLVEAQGGRICINKKATPGTTICFTIPLVPMHTPAVVVEEER